MKTLKIKNKNVIFLQKNVACRKKVVVTTVVRFLIITDTSGDKT